MPLVKVYALTTGLSGYDAIGTKIKIPINTIRLMEEADAYKAVEAGTAVLASQVDLRNPPTAKPKRNYKRTDMVAEKAG